MMEREHSRRRPVRLCEDLKTADEMTESRGVRTAQRPDEIMSREQVIRLLTELIYGCVCVCVVSSNMMLLP